MNLNTWKKAIALGFPERGTPGTGMLLTGPLETTVAYRRDELPWGWRLLSQGECCTC